MSEITENRDIISKHVGTLFYDGTCGMCTRWVLRVNPILKKRGVEVKSFINGRAEREMHLQLVDGREFGGADAAWILAGRIWWAWPVWILGWLPGARPLMRLLYRWIADRRHCHGGRCELVAGGKQKSVDSGQGRQEWMAWTVSLVLLGIGWSSASEMPKWGLMWTMAVSLFLAFKGIMLSQLREGSARDRIAFLLLWPGMDAGRFMIRKKGGCNGDAMTARILFPLTGLVLIVLGGRYVKDPYLAGWFGMIGLICLLHFGLFAWITWIWQQLGHEVRPIMESPWRARSLTDFWGRRWNRAFSDVARVTVFRPMSRRWGISVAMISGFGFSGLAHELVISMPSGAAYGLPGLYFLIQALGILIERKFAWNGSLARTWTWMVVLGPAGLLFPPVFMEQVITPFLHAVT